MSRKVAVVTGGHAGIGFELSKLLLRDDWHLVLLMRQGAGEDALRKLKSEKPGAAIDIIRVDLADRNDVEQASKALLERFPSIDALFNNAGVLLDKAYYSPQGNEMHFEVDTLAPYHLMTSLLPALSSAKGIVINTSSGSINKTGPLDVDGLRRPTKFRKLFGPYAQSKLALTMLTVALAEEFRSHGVILRSVEPGAIKTSMTSGKGMPSLLLWLRPILFKSPALGGLRLYQAAFDAKYRDLSGIHIVKGKVAKVPPAATDRATQEKLIELCRDLTSTPLKEDARSLR